MIESAEVNQKIEELIFEQESILVALDSAHESRAVIEKVESILAQRLPRGIDMGYVDRTDLMAVIEFAKAESQDLADARIKYEAARRVIEILLKENLALKNPASIEPAGPSH